ncbi:GRAS family transcription factor [Artemisia annua]|uniref:GRAS family transcription factor n=1 Tax=Artemisia annua TaxID=35608 RepID=A0A2U1NP36_ARTAN|nr:GRAS family transcription factor [Artemisia annua]
MPIFSDNNRTRNNGQMFDNSFSSYDQPNNGSNRYHPSSGYSQNFRGLQFSNISNPPLPDVRAGLEDELHEDCDLSDAILGYISQVLMEEDMEDRSCMLQESVDLQAAEKPFYEVLGKKYPPSPPPWPPPEFESGLTYADHNGNGLYADSFSGSSGGYALDASNLHYFGGQNISYASLGSSSTGGLDSPASTADTFDLYNENQMMSQFRKGAEEANKFLPTGNLLLGSNNIGQDQTREESKLSLTKPNIRKNPYREDITEVEKQERVIKQAAIFPDATLRSEEMDLIFLSSLGEADDRRKANELLNEIRQHASPFGDGTQRLAHCFANGLEARLAGTGSQIHKGLVSKKTCAADYIRAYHLYMASSPFRKISNFASNRTIMDKAENSMRVHIIDFGILYGFQWPTFLQRISTRKGGPPHVRITGIEFPQPGFRPAQRIEETGRRLEAYAEHFKVPFEYHSIAKRWENVKVEELMLKEDEFLVVNCLYRSKNLLDETVVADSARNIVLNLIKKINPDIFIHGILNGSYNAPFFLTRFREALFHFSALFDMLETNVPRERPERMLLEREIFGREALNVIACEGWERSERPETYKQWHVRNLRVGLVPVPFSRFIATRAAEKVSLYHKDFLIDEDNNWLLQGWKGRIIYAISCWKPA